MDANLRTVFDKLFEPRSVAFIGATDTPGKWGFTILMHIFQGGYSGELHLINPKRDKVFDLPCKKSLDEIEGIPDIAVIVVPAKYVRATVDDCLAKGIRALVVITSGFAETGEEGRKLQDDLVAATRAVGAHFVGPNSMGIFTGYPDRLCSMMASVVPTPGPVGVIVQSGNLGTSLMTRLMRRNIGISRAFSTGNQADITITDYLEALTDDPKTDIIVIYLEGIDDGRRFLATAEAAARKKPVLLLKGGRGKLGAKAAQSHTAALSGSHDVFTAAMREVGVVCSDSMDEMINIIGALHSHPLPKGNRTGVLTLGGGWGVLATDACERYGVGMPELPKDVYEELDAMLPDYWSKGNPVDTVATLDIAMLGKALTLLMESDGFDSVIYLGAGYLAYGGSRYKQKGPGYKPEYEALGDYVINLERNLTERIIELSTRCKKPFLPVADLVARDMSTDNNIVKMLEAQGIFVHNAPWQAAHALSALLERKAFLERIDAPAPAVPLPDDTRLSEAQAAVQAGLTRAHGQLTEHEGKAVLAAMGIACPPEAEVDDIDQAVQAAEQIGYPVALKLSNPEILHKTEAGGVVLDLRDAAAVREQAARLLKQGRVLVQKMADRAPVELLAGLQTDSTFGPIVVFGKGGIETEVWRDVAYLPAPITPAQAERLIEATRIKKLIAPFRGRPALDRAALVDLLVRLSHIPTHFPEIREFDINPLSLYESGVLALDAAAIVQPLESHD